MARMKTTDTIDKLRQKKAQLEAQLKAAEARERETSRKEDTRRKVIAGALALEHFEKNNGSEFAKVFHRLLDEYVTRPADRRLFPSLPELPEGSKGKASGSPALSAVPDAAE